MSKLITMSMSLDGDVADLNDGVAEVFDWHHVPAGSSEQRSCGTQCARES